MTQIHKVQPFC